MKGVHSWVEVSAIRAGVYHLLALAFLQPSPSRIAALRNEAARDLLRRAVATLPHPHWERAAMFYQEVIEDACQEEPTALQKERTLEYCRLFVGPDHLPAPPYGSVYLDGGVVMGPSALAAGRAYEREGLAPLSFDEPLDHVAVELEFMGHLCQWQGRALADGDNGSAKRYFASQRSFLREHLGRWAGIFAERVLAATTSPFYRALALLLSTWVAIDKDLVEAIALAEAQKDEEASVPCLQAGKS